VHDASCVRTLELLSFFVFLHCDWTTALMGSVICGASVVLLSMSVGSFGWHLVRFMLLLCCVSAVNTWLCYIGTSEERIQFAKVKHIKLAAKQSRMSLSTLIPPNVLSRLAYRKNDAGILATEIAHCTIMFCSLVDSGSRKRQFRADNLSPDAAEFQRLHAVYLAFDEVVKMSVIYKYQHVGPWYILACPNAAEPFRELNDPSEGEREGDEGRERVLPRRGSGGGGSAATQWARDSETRRRWGGSWRSSVERVSYGTEMAQLALSLRTIAHHHGFDLKVGVHTGSAAGAVIGKLRAFYCIYGATVNTASRLCGHARPGEIIGSDGFVECLKAEHDKMAAGADGKAAPSWPVITFECRGRQLLKGFSTSIATFAIDGDVATRRVAEGKAFALSKEEFNVDAFPAQRLTLGRRGSEEQDPMISLLKYSDLSQESHLLLQDERLRISGRRILGEHIAISFGFADARIDEQYNEDYWPAMRHRIAGTFVLHFTGILVQYLHVAFPEFFDALASEHSDSGGGAAVTVGNVFEGKYPDLTAMHAHVSTLLLVHLLWTGNACVGLLAALYKGPVRWTEKIGLLALILRIIWALVSVWASHVWPVRSYTVIFTPLYASCQFMIQCASFRVSARLFVVMQLIVLVAFWLSAELLQPLFVSRYIASCIIVCLSNVWAEDSRLRRWRLHRVFRSEMKRFDDILSDLMPMKADIMPFPLAASSDTAPSTTSALAAGDEEPAGVRAGSGDQPRPAKPLSLQLSLRRPSGTYDWNRSCSFHELEAVVLQLDICGFTQFSREVTAMELALTLHHVFSVFDSYVQRLHLFKMDTVGDAYIVAAWLVQDENARETESRWRQQLCHKVLWCAANMLHTIRLP
jgi:class 3 adenylate cyclase